jgi:hypothetical protein
MRYRAGTIKLSPKDGALLKIAGTATHITNGQLFELARLKSIEHDRRVYNWRVERLVQHDLLRNQEPLYRGSDPVYSITRNGVAGLEQLGIHLLSVYVDGKEAGVKHQVQHGIELNTIHIALLASGALADWLPAKFLQALNLTRPFNYAKYYDAVATVYVGAERIELAIEYEQTLKRPTERYAAIKAKFDKEERADAILFVVPTWEICLPLRSQFTNTRKDLLFAKLPDLTADGLDAAVEHNYLTVTLRQALERIASQRNGPMRVRSGHV